MDNTATKEPNRFMVEIERTIYSNADRMEMNMTSTVYKATLKEANKIAREEVAKGNHVEIWKLVGKYK
jgi:hypothetical protein